MASLRMFRPHQPEPINAVRSFRPPEPYKGKGVKYVEERIQRKVGKAGAA